jgi:hypothetical protein
LWLFFFFFEDVKLDMVEEFCCFERSSWTMVMGMRRHWKRSSGTCGGKQQLGGGRSSSGSVTQLDILRVSQANSNKSTIIRRARSCKKSSTG